MTTTPLFSNMLDPEIDKNFSVLCGDAEGDVVIRLKQDIEEHLGEVHAALSVNEFLDFAAAEKIASTLRYLLDQIDKYPHEKQRLIIGAARYFVRTHDAQPDMESLLGFDDDVEILNFVLVEIGHSEMRIKL